MTIKTPNELLNFIKNSYEKQQFGEVIDWKGLKPSVVSQVFGKILQPVSWLIQIIVPNSAIRATIKSCNGASKFLIDKENFKKECNISNIEELLNHPLEECDGYANKIHNWAIGYATTEGGATGAAGLPGMIIDIPAIITLAFRTINKIGLCYGYESKTEEDNQVVLSILSAAGANSMREKQLALLTLKQLQVIIVKTTWKKMAEKAIENEFTKEAGIIALRSLAKQLGLNLTKRKALQTIPLIGAAVGASVNASFIQDVGWAARRIFQERWIKEKYKKDIIYDEYENI